ncbi:KIP1-like protein [Musa troglodytarum]|uniref:KIP1-like protein n=1 Tax=Musa troglodytarum TaxID=320322 RepID=A0A9E7L4A7_9LILI|nr:KIP1-like protein [Musa troglodytarum]
MEKQLDLSAQLLVESKRSIFFSLAGNVILWLLFGDRFIFQVSGFISQFDEDRRRKIFRDICVVSHESMCTKLQ